MTRYKSPKQRRRGQMRGMGPDEQTPPVPSPGESPEPGNSPGPGDNPQEEQGEQSPIFIPRAAQGGREYKAGDTITMTVKAVDPETGELEAVCDSGPEEQPEGADTMQAFDQQMPAEES